MKEFWERFKVNLANWMQGRNGFDELTIFTAIIGFVLVFIGSLVDLDVLSYLSLIALGYALFRCYSKNIMQRRKENAAFQKIIAKPKKFFSSSSKQWANRKTTSYFKCEGCGSMLSVPKGKGTIRITCPKCHAQSTRKS